MSTLLYGMQRTPIPTDEAKVRSTVTVVQADAPASEAPHTPDVNEKLSDTETEGGLTSRDLAPHVATHRERPSTLPHAFAHSRHDEDVNERVSSDGTAAAREASGEWGHGTIYATEGIEPTIHDGHRFGADYFVTHPRAASHAGAYLTPAETSDPAIRARAQAGATANAREAVTESLYNAMHAARMGR